MTDQEFYSECAKLLGVEYDGIPFKYRKRTRWNNRVPGSGRFYEKGIIRVFGNTVHVALNEPECHKIFDSKEAVLEFLKKD